MKRILSKIIVVNCDSEGTCALIREYPGRFPRVCLGSLQLLWFFFFAFFLLVGYAVLVLGTPALVSGLTLGLPNLLFLPCN